MGAEKKSVILTIRGRKYPLRTEADDQRLEQVVELVTNKLDELDLQSTAKSGAAISDMRLVMLALLNVADECLTHRQSLGDIKVRADNLNAELSPLLPDETGPIELDEFM